MTLAIDLFSLAIVGWETSTIKDTEFVKPCLKRAGGGENTAIDR